MCYGYAGKTGRAAFVCEEPEINERSPQREQGYSDPCFAAGSNPMRGSKFFRTSWSAEYRPQRA